MNMIRKDRKGFSLVEMVLSIAIVIIIGGVVAGLCAAISGSFISTYNLDDSADYALLYARGFENSFLANSQVIGKSGYTWTWKVNDPILTITTPDKNSKPVFVPKYMKNSETTYRWSVRMFFTFDGDAKDAEGKVTTEGTNIVKYRIFIKDKTNSTDFIYTYDGSFWLPRYDQRAQYQGVGDSRQIKLTGSTMEAGTFTDYTPAQKASIASLMDENYKSEIQFIWG